MEIILAGSVYTFLDYNQLGGRKRDSVKKFNLTERRKMRQEERKQEKLRERRAKNRTTKKIYELAMKYINNGKRPETIILELTGNKKLQDKLNTYIKNKSSTEIKKDINCLEISGMQVGGMHQGEPHDFGDDKCGICLDTLRGGRCCGNRPIATLVCGHEFHRQCIRDWWRAAAQNSASRGLHYTPSCPMCFNTRGIRGGDSICEMVSQAENDFRDGALDLVGIRPIPHLTDGQRRAQDAIQGILLFLFMALIAVQRLNNTVL